MDTKLQAPGEVRKDIYAWLESEGFEMTEKRHKQLSQILKLNANAKNEEVLAKLHAVSAKCFHYEMKLGIRGKYGHLINPANKGTKVKML